MEKVKQMSKYVSSIINNYGDMPNVQKDAKILHDILNRQGSRIFLEVMTDHLATVTSTHNLNHIEIERVVTGNINLYAELVAERT